MPVSLQNSPPNISLTGNPILFRLAGQNAFENGLLRNLYRIVIKLETTEEVARIDLPVIHPTADDISMLPYGWNPSDVGIASINISELFQMTVNGHFTFPEPDSSIVFLHQLVFAFEIIYSEKWGIPPVENESDSHFFHFMQGKLSNFRQGQLNYLGSSFFEMIYSKAMFLTWAPVEKVTDIYAPERLYFLFLISGAYHLKITEYYGDGTTKISTLVSFTAGLYEIREFLVSYKKIRTASIKKVIKYEVYLADASDNRFSEIRTFIIDYRYQPYARYFLFKNSLGVYELVRTTGKVSKNRKTDKDFVWVPLPDNFTHLDREEKQITQVTETNYTVNSGYFASKYDAEWFQELLTSDDVYWLKQGVAYPVSLQSGKQLVSDDGNFTPSCEFNIIHSLHDDFTEEFNANEPIIIGDFNIDFNTDFFVGSDNGGAPLNEVFHSNFDNWAVNPAFGVELPTDFNFSSLGGLLGARGSVVNESNKARIATGSAGSASWNQIIFKPKISLAAGSYQLSFNLIELSNPAACFEVIAYNIDTVYIVNIVSVRESGAVLVTFDVTQDVQVQCTFGSDDVLARNCLIDDFVISKL